MKQLKPVKNPQAFIKALSRIDDLLKEALVAKDSLTVARKIIKASGEIETCLRVLELMAASEEGRKKPA